MAQSPVISQFSPLVLLCRIISSSCPRSPVFGAIIPHKKSISLREGESSTRSSLKLFTVGQELSDWEENDHNSRIIRVERPTHSAASGHLQETTLICAGMLLDRNVLVKWDYQTGAVDSRGLLNFCHAQSSGFNPQHYINPA